MRLIAAILTGIVAVLHICFLILEMFLWQTNVGLHIFNMTPEAAAYSAVLAKNQGLYNGFLAAGLIWTFFISDKEFQKLTRTFFLLCIIVAGIFGGLTAKMSIIFIQALPALLALIAVRYSK
jgi:putative membrane protein